MNIVDPILFQCRRQPPTAAICVPGPGIGLISYRRLERSIHNISRSLHEIRLPERSIVAVNVADVILHTAILLSLMRLGMITLSVRAGDNTLPVTIDALITDSKHPLAEQSRVIPVDASWIEGDSRPLESHLLPQTHEDDLCRFILTSGTSSTPKVVALSHKLLANRIARHSTFGNRIANCSRIYSDVPISSSLGFQFLMSALTRGGTAYFSGENFPLTLRMFEDYKVQCLVGSPGGFENLLRWFDTVPSYQSSIEVIVCAGDILSHSLSARLRSRICSHLVSMYGSTEASMTAIANAHELATVPRAVGYVTPGITVQIVDPSEKPLPPGEEGQLRVRSEFAVDGYFGNDEETQKVFRDGWFYPRDTGTLNADGLLVITGREHSLLNLGGDKIKPEIIEAVLAQFPGVAQVAAAATPNVYGNNEVCAVIVSQNKIDEAALRAHCAAQIPPAFAPTSYYFVAELPRNEMGKLDRNRLHEMIQAMVKKPTP